MSGAIAIWATDATSSVPPSGLARATYWVPIVPPAPARFDDERLREYLRHVVGEQPGRQIHDAAGLVRHDHADRPVGPILDLGGGLRADKERSKEHESDVGASRPSVQGRADGRAPKDGSQPPDNDCSVRHVCSLRGRLPFELPTPAFSLTPSQTLCHRSSGRRRHALAMENATDRSDPSRATIDHAHLFEHPALMMHAQMRRSATRTAAVACAVQLSRERRGAGRPARKGARPRNRRPIPTQGARFMSSPFRSRCMDTGRGTRWAPETTKAHVQVS